MDLIKILPKQGELTKTGWNLPTNLSKNEWTEIGSKFSEVSGAVQWAWGDWWNAGIFEHGERKAMVESEGWSGLAYQTLKIYGEVCSRFEMVTRVNLLTFRHHQECVSLPIEEALKVLDWAVENVASTRKTTEKVKEVKSWLAQGWTTDQLERKQKIEQGISVVASKRDNVDSALIAWADQQGKVVEIGRNTKWGNPFEMPADGTRDNVCDNYEKYYLPNKPSLLKSLKLLKGKVLVCWCYPERCHGDSLLKLL